MSMGFSRQEQWNGLPFPPPGDLPNPGIKPVSPISPPDSSVGKESTCNAGDLGSITGLGRSAEEGKGYPLQYSGLENSMDSVIHGVAECQTQLSAFHFTLAEK